MSTGTTCPDRVVLERLLLGQIPLPEAEVLESHVSTCSQCAAILQRLNAEDPLVDAMRKARDPLAPAAAAVAEALMPWLKRLQRTDTTQAFTPPPNPNETASMDVSPTHTGTPAATTSPTFDFLTAPQQPDELGRLEQYRVLQTIGVGGMGMVFRAEDTRLQRQVALKVIKPELLERQDLHERFLSEARAIAAVEHDNIVAIYEANHAVHAGGVPYLVMPLLRGESLEDCLKRDDRPLPIDAILRLGREIAAGLEAAHACGLVHRDIKPSNLWLEARDEGRGAGDEKYSSLAPRPTPHAWRIKILDFGLARTLDTSNEAGEHRAILGTPAYMSPEQGRGLPADARSDLFSLGCVMYRMATGRAPFRGKDVITTLMSVATETPVSPKELNPKLPADLVALIEKLLAKKPADRFASGQEVVDAVRKIERKRQPKRIGRWLAALAACVALASAATFGVFSYLHRPPAPVEVTLEYDEPDAVLVLQLDDGPKQEIAIKKAARQKLTPGTYTVRLKKDVEDRQLWPARFVVNADEPMVVPFRLVGLIRTYDGHARPIRSVAVLPRKDAALALSGSDDFDLRLWDLHKADAGIRIVGHESPVRCLAISPDGNLAITGSGKASGRRPDIFVRLWDLDTKTCLAKLDGHEHSVSAVAWDPKRKLFLSGDLKGVVIYWDAKTRQRLHIVDAQEGSAVFGLAFLPDGKQALSCGSDAKLFLWDIEKRQVVKKFAGHTDTITAVSVAPDGQHAATAGKDGAIRLWDLATGKSRVLSGHEKDVDCVAYAPDGKRLLSGGRDATVRLWNAETAALIHTFVGHKGAVHAVAFEPDGRRALSGGADLSLHWWELPK